MSSLLTITVGEVKDSFYVGTEEDEPRGTSNSNQFDLLSGRTYPPATPKTWSLLDVPEAS